MISPPNYTPNNPLSAFHGIDKFGLWSITVIDNAAGDLGTLDSWSLHMVNEEPCGTCPWDTDGDGKVDAVDLAEELNCWASPHDGSATCTCLDTAGAGPDGNIDAGDLADLLAKWSGDANNNGIPDACPGG